MAIASPSYMCDFGPSGTSSVSPACQYLVTISPQRLGGGIMIWQVTDTPFAVNGATNLTEVTSGSLFGGASVQVCVPGSTTNTITISVNEP